MVLNDSSLTSQKDGLSNTFHFDFPPFLRPATWAKKIVIWCSIISAIGKEHASHTFILLTFIQAWVLRQNEKQKGYAQKSGQRSIFSILFSLFFIISQMHA